MDTAGVIGVVLCGGASRRMGEDKAGLQVRGRVLLDHAVATLEGICEEVLLACGDAPRYEERGLRCVLDSVAGRGPLEGIASCLEEDGVEWAVVLPCDLPRVVPEVPGVLLERAQKEDLDACLFRSRRGREPLMAVYRRSTLGAMREALSNGLRRVDSFHSFRTPEGSPLKIGSLDEGELSDEAKVVDVSVNLNTPAELISEQSHTAEALA